MNTKVQPNTNSPYKFAWFFFKPYSQWVIFFICIAITAGLLLPMQSYFYKRLIDGLSHATMDSLTIKEIIWSGICILVALKLHMICWRIFNVVELKTAPIIKNNIINYSFEYIHKKSYNFFQDNLGGTISKNIMALADKVGLLAYHYSAQIIRGITQTIVAGNFQYSCRL